MTNSTWAPLPSVLFPSNGRPIGIVWSSELYDGARPAVAGANLRRREIHLHPSLRRQPAERSRILTHELFHFAWIRLGNPRRAGWKALLQAELAARARGELGWSSQWRKDEGPKDFAAYACESFCDSAAAFFSACPDHEEYTLAPRWRAKRRAWFQANIPMAC